MIAGSDPTGAAPYVNTYDEYGRGGGSRAFRFGFTGQMALGPDRLYFKARMYDPGLGRFMQPDPIGYGDGMNMYAYVGGDPINFIDPTGTEEIVVTGKKCGTLCQIGRALRKLLGGDGGDSSAPSGGFSGGGSSTFGGGGGAQAGWGVDPSAKKRDPRNPAENEIVIVGQRPSSAIDTSLPPANTVYFGYPPESNSAHHVDRHLKELDASERAALKRKITKDVHPQLPPGRQQIGFVVFKGLQYEYRAFGLPGGVTNVSTVFRVDD